MLGYTRDSVTDGVLNAVAHHARRRILFAIYEDAQDGSEFPLESAAVPDFGAVDVQHALADVHLPHLENAGYVRFDPERQTLAKGPEWTQIEPLLRLIYGHLDELPVDLRGERLTP